MAPGNRKCRIEFNDLIYSSPFLASPPPSLFDSIKLNGINECLRQINATTAGRSSSVIGKNRTRWAGPTGPNWSSPPPPPPAACSAAYPAGGVWPFFSRLFFFFFFSFFSFPSLCQINTFDKNTTSLFIIFPPPLPFSFILPPFLFLHMSSCGWRREKGGTGRGGEGGEEEEEDGRVKLTVDGRQVRMDAGVLPTNGTKTE